jgi:hypothetical protein
MTRAAYHPRKSLTTVDQPALADLRQALGMLDVQNKEPHPDKDYDTMIRAAALVRVAVAKLEKAGPPTTMLATPQEYIL